MMRDAKGRFIKGITGNPNGRPTRATEQEYLDAAKEIVPLDRFRKMVDKQAQRADHGDIRAFECIVRLLGIEPAKKVDLTTDGESLNTITVKGVDYRTAITNLAPRPMGDSDASSEGESTFDGSQVG